MLMKILNVTALALLAPLPAHAAGPPPSWAKCGICHANVKGAPPKMGPNLAGVGGATAGGRPGYAYSAALKASRLVWNRTTLARYLADPAKTVPGTTMPNPALTLANRDALAAYLAMLK